MDGDVCLSHFQAVILYLAEKFQVAGDDAKQRADATMVLMELSTTSNRMPHCFRFLFLTPTPPPRMWRFLAKSGCQVTPHLAIIAPAVNFQYDRPWGFIRAGAPVRLRTWLIPTFRISQRPIRSHLTLVLNKSTNQNTGKP